MFNDGCFGNSMPPGRSANAGEHVKESGRAPDENAFHYVREIAAARPQRQYRASLDDSSGSWTESERSIKQRSVNLLCDVTTIEGSIRVLGQVLKTQIADLKTCLLSTVNMESCFCRRKSCR